MPLRADDTAYNISRGHLRHAIDATRFSVDISRHAAAMLFSLTVITLSPCHASTLLITL